MHRATPLQTSFRSYSSGGSRSVVSSVDDSKLMQEMSGGIMANELRTQVEAAQNYGFTSVTMDGDTDGQGNVTSGPETFISFMGGNRSFPASGNIDDRRHRLMSLQKGDSAMFRTKSDKQQFHMTSQGTFWSTRDDRTNRIALVAQGQQSGSGSSGGGSSGGGSAGGQVVPRRRLRRFETWRHDPRLLEIEARDITGGGGGSSGGNGASGAGGQQNGQTNLVQANQQSQMYFQQTKDATIIQHQNGYTKVTQNAVETYYQDDTVSTKATTDHVHIRFKNFAVWVNASGCFSSVPINTQQDPDG